MLANLFTEQLADGGTQVNLDQKKIYNKRKGTPNLDNDISSMFVIALYQVVEEQIFYSCFLLAM